MAIMPLKPLELLCRFVVQGNDETALYLHDDAALGLPDVLPKMKAGLGQ